MDDLPPTLPATLEQLDHARMLLGERVRTPLRRRSELKLVSLVGAAPDAQQAAAWKRALGVYREELLGELGSAHDEVAQHELLARTG